MMLDQVKADYMLVGDKYHIVLQRGRYFGLIAVREAGLRSERIAIDRGFGEAGKYKQVPGVPFRISQTETGVVVDEPETPFRLRAQVRARSESGKILRSWYFVGTTGPAEKAGVVTFAPKESAVFVPKWADKPEVWDTVLVVDILFGEDLGSWTHEVFAPVSLQVWQGFVVGGVVTRTR